MPDIFVSYARQDRERVRVLASQLEEDGWTIWWDRQIFAGTDFDVVIQRELDDARCVVVVWSKHSVSSRWAKAEAGEGLRREILIPLLIDDAYPPLSFRNIQTVSFGDAALDRGSPAFQELLESLTNLLGAPPVQLLAAPVAPHTAQHAPGVSSPPRQPVAVEAPCATARRPGPGSSRSRAPTRSRVRRETRSRPGQSRPRSW